MISRTIQQLSEKHGMVNMVLYCMSTVGKRSSVILKILSREVQVVLPNDCCSPSDPVPCMPALKLAFCVPDLSMVNEGEGVGGQTGAISYRDAIHIPLPAADWQKVIYISDDMTFIDIFLLCQYTPMASIILYYMNHFMLFCYVYNRYIRYLPVEVCICLVVNLFLSIHPFSLACCCCNHQYFCSCCK